MKTFSIQTLIALFLISGIHFVFADCPDEQLKAEGSFFINEADEAYIYGQASVSNLTYWPAKNIEQAHWPALLFKRA